MATQTLTTLKTHLLARAGDVTSIESSEFDSAFIASNRPENEYPRLEIMPDMPAGVIDRNGIMKGATTQTYNLILTMAGTKSNSDTTSIWGNINALELLMREYLYKAFDKEYANSFILMTDPQLTYNRAGGNDARCEVVAKLQVRVNVDCAE